MPIKVTKLSEPTLREIKVKCPECGKSLFYAIPKTKKEDKETCPYCGTKFKWEETNAH